MRFSISVSTFWGPFMRLFGFGGERAYVELDDEAITFRYGTATERVPLSEIESVGPRAWPFYYGLGAKIGPDHGVAYVASLDGVVQVRFTSPRPMNVWGPFRTSKARCVTLSLEDPEGFMAALGARIA